MKIVLGLIIVLFSSIAIGAPCNGAPGNYFVNADGSNGGFVQKGAWVEKNNYISFDSEVCDKVIIKGRNQILDGSSIRENVVIEGSALIRDSIIYGYAKIKGLTTIQNSQVCQGSNIEGIKVLNSKYFCQTEDPQPKDPGERGLNSLLGVDSDGDGVRDDVEIWINNNISNTLKDNKALERINTKNLAKLLQQEFLLVNNAQALKQIESKKRLILNCINLSMADEIYTQIYNTKDRYYSLIKARGNFHGEKVENLSISCNHSTDYFVSPVEFKRKQN